MSIEQYQKEIADIVEKWEIEAPKRVALFDDDDALEKVDAEKIHMATVLKHMKLEKIYSSVCMITYLGAIAIFILYGLLENFNLNYLFIGSIFMILWWLFFGSLSKDETHKIEKLTTLSPSQREDRYNKKAALMLEQLADDIERVNDLKNALAKEGVIIKIDKYQKEISKKLKRKNRKEKTEEEKQKTFLEKTKDILIKFVWLLFFLINGLLGLISWWWVAYRKYD